MNNIFLIGDSTCQNNDESTFPQVGWGQFFEEYLKNPAKVHNFAKMVALQRVFLKSTDLIV